MKTIVETTTERETNSARVQPPLFKGMPFIGSGLNFLNNPMEFLLKAHGALGPVFRVKILNRELIILSGQQANCFFVDRSPELFCSETIWSGFAKEVGTGFFLPGLNGVKHKELRNITRRSYSTQSLEARIPELLELIDYRFNFLKLGKKIDIVEVMRRVACESLALLLANSSPEDDYKDFVYFIDTIVDVTVAYKSPSILLKTPAYKRGKRKALNIAKRIVKEHQMAKNNGTKNDLVDDILESFLAKGGLPPVEDFFIALLSPFIAGLDTIANTISFLLYHVSKDSTFKSNIQDEIDIFFEQPNIDLDSIKNMKLLRSSLFEVLRLNNPTPFIMRTSRQGFEFSGYWIEQGKEIMMVHCMTHFLEELFDKPFEFQPDRFLKGVNAKKPRSYVPFGLGSHACPGAGLSDPLLNLIFSRMMYRLNFSLEPKNYQLKQTLKPLVAPANLRFSLSKRESSITTS